MEIYDRFMSSDVTKAVLNTPCTDKYGGKCLSKDNSKAVACDRFGRPKSDKKRPHNGKNGNKKGGDGGPSSKKKKGNKDGKKVRLFSRYLNPYPKITFLVKINL